MLNASSEPSYTVPRSIKTRWNATEELHAHPIPEEVPGIYNSRMTDDEFEIFARLDGGVRLEARVFYSAFSPQSSEVDHGARYFDDEDLYRRLNDEYDYPQGVDEEDEAFDILEDQTLFDDEVMWADLGEGEIEDAGDRHVQMALEEEMIDARYFDANDLYDRRGFRNPVYGDEETDLEHQEFKDSLQGGPRGRKELSGLPPTGGGFSSLQRVYDG